MENFFKKVEKRAAETAEDVMRKYAISLKDDDKPEDTSPTANNEEPAEKPAE